MLKVFFNIRGIVHHEYVPEGKSVNAKFYVEILKRLRVRHTRSELWAKNAWILHQDSAPSHTAFVTREFLAKNNIITIDHPP